MTASAPHRRPRPLVSPAYENRRAQSRSGQDTAHRTRRPRPLVSPAYQLRRAGAQPAPPSGDGGVDRADRAEETFASPAPRLAHEHHPRLRSLLRVPVRLATMAVPVLASVGTAVALSGMVHRPAGLWSSVGWVVAIVAASATVLLVVDRLGRRLLPMADRPRLTKVVSWVTVGFGMGLVAAVALPAVVGGRSFVVMSGSMEPAIHTGDVVVTLPIQPTKARPGDVVTFRDPTDPDRLVTHRVRRIQPQGKMVAVDTKGDANNTGERWHVPASGRIGRVSYRAWQIGYVLHVAGSPPGRVLLIGCSAVALCALTLVRIWRPAVVPVPLPSPGAVAAGAPTPDADHSWSLWDPFPIG